MPGALVSRLSWDEVETRLAAGARVVVPVGAGSKEHGHHLPMGTDAIQARWLGEAMTARYSVLVWPTIEYGYYPAFIAYPGSVTLSRPSFEAQLNDILGGLRNHTDAHMLVLNTGISTIAPIDETVSRYALCTAVHVNQGTQLRRTAKSVCHQRHGGHGDEAETSIMLAIAPDTVRMSRASDWDKPVGRGPLSREPASATYTPQGVWGAPSEATSSKGHALIASMLKDIDDVYRQLEN
jgi:creatinine amidohydrolase